MPPIKKARQSGSATDHPTVVGFTIVDGGDLPDVGAPTKFVAAPNDIVLWVVGNTSGYTITVTLTDFLRKKHPADPKGTIQPETPPFIWLVSDTVVVDDGKVGFIAGRRNPDYQTQSFLFHDFLSYTIHVQSTAFDFEYDPDGDIKP